MIAEVAFNIPLERTFHYLIPSTLRDAVVPGVRVKAPFGPKERQGFVVRVLPKSPLKELKSIRRTVDPRPVIAGERWELAAWLSSTYYCSLGEALAAMVPTALRLTAQPHAPAPDAHSEPAHLELSAAQRRAFELIASALKSPQSKTLVLHGVTGSGKTELYLQAIDLVLRQGRGAICLVPEISLTLQTIDRFRERFGDQVALWHSRLTATQRAQAWVRLERGEARIVVGARSAVFAPVTHLGLVILDEEHESTYKQEDTPRYHAREVAAARATLTGATVLLGSATPSVESYYAAAKGSGRLVTLPERVAGRSLPKVEIIDMREELSRRHRMAPLSDRLQRLIQEAVDQEEQVMLLLNRRGFSRIVQCPTCGTVVRCSRCSVPLIFHAARGELICHYCNFHQPPAELCGQCRKGYLRFRGTGTERVESELHRLFPTQSIARMDADTTKRRESHRELYEAFKARQVIMLVGTQMIAKGLDFPEVTLVGVVSADTALNLPDFRAGERTFDLLTQVAGRAGRGARPGRVLIQTYYPTHYAIEAAQHHDYQRFYAEEIRMRRRLALPPFCHLIELTLHASSRPRADDAAQALAAGLKRAAARPATRGTSSPARMVPARAAGRQRIILLGPAPHRIPRVRRTYRVCLVLKGRAAEPMVGILRQVLQPGRRFQGLPVTVDVDPL
ncbi:MAG: primosomal protein N' [Candidatus Omnitrophota bacterium]|nr:primosomal protein N' [Candidatus Omnitrophota bacterium]